MAALTATALAISAVGTGVGVFGQMQQAKSAEQAGKFNAQIAKNEAILNEQTAVENIRRKRADNRRFLSRQNALFAAKGIALEGTALELIGTSASNLDTEIQDAFHQAQLGVNRSNSQAALALFNADAASGAAKLNAVSTGLKGASSFASGLSTELI